MDDYTDDDFRYLEEQRDDLATRYANDIKDMINLSNGHIINYKILCSDVSLYDIKKKLKQFNYEYGKDYTVSYSSD